MIVETYRWDQSRRDFLADDLVAKECPECGYGHIHWHDYTPPHFNPPGAWASVVLNRAWCTNFGACEGAPG